MSTSILRTKSFAFAVLIIKLVQRLQKEKKEFVISNQIARSGVSVGSLIREAEYAQSKRDFISKMSISLKEDNETEYLLQLLEATDYIGKSEFLLYHSPCQEIKAMLISSIKTAKANMVEESMKKKK